MSRTTRMHGTHGTGDVRLADGRVVKFTGWFHSDGWRGHAPVELARRRRRNKAARAARKRNRAR